MTDTKQTIGQQIDELITQLAVTQSAFNNNTDAFLARLSGLEDAHKELREGQIHLRDKTWNQYRLHQLPATRKLAQKTATDLDALREVFLGWKEYNADNPQRIAALVERVTQLEETWAKILLETPFDHMKAVREGDQTVRRPCVVVESPYRMMTADHPAASHIRNTEYLRAALAECLQRGEAPFASHGLYTQPGVLDDDDPKQRLLGIEAGHAWITACDYVVVYQDLGISEGMQQGIDAAKRLGKRVEYRDLEGWK